MNKDMHLNENGKRINIIDSASSRTLTHVAPASEAALIPLLSSPQAALDKTLTCLRQAVDNNFTPAFFVIALAGMVKAMIDNLFNDGARLTS